LAAIAARGLQKDDNSKSREELETEKLLQEKDEEIQRMQQMLQQMQAKLSDKT